ncbi:MAG TPA: substrate-binding domain-containing protein [Puia sp.]|jgi:LacI family transcriptional regulator|nr:substrate-binding domain-containing protein [Puia sp.]
MPIPANTPTRGNNRIIAMLVDQISDPFLAEFARRLDRRARCLGYKLVFGNTESDIRFTTKLISVFHNMNVAGYIIAPPAGIDFDLRKLLNRDRPVVLFDTDDPGGGACRVCADNYRGGYDAVAHLATNGYRDIGFLAPDSVQKRMVDRRQGYEKAVEDFRLETRLAKIPVLASPEAIAAAIKKLLWETGSLDALVFADNNIAFTGMGVLRQLKLQAPRDLAVVAFDDNDYFSLFSPGITAVTQPLNEMVEKILECIIHPRAKTGGTAPAARIGDAADTVILPTRLVVRESSAPAPVRRRKAASMFPGAAAKLSEM